MEKASKILVGLVVVVLLLTSSVLVVGYVNGLHYNESNYVPYSATVAPTAAPTVVEKTPTVAAPSAGGSAGGGLSFSAHQVPISANDLAYGFYSGAAARGYTYVGFYCTLTNNGASTYETSIVMLQLKTTAGVYTDSPYIYQKGEFPTGDVSLRNGEVVNGVALFEVPTGTTGFNSITYSDGSYNLRAGL